MADDSIPSDIQKFLSRYVRSVGHLETLLFLFEGRDRDWTIEELAKKMRTNESMVKEHILDLNGVVASSKTDRSSYRFVSNEDQETSNVIIRLQELYRSRKHAVINAIYDRPLDAIRSFAEAFKLKKD